MNFLFLKELTLSLSLMVFVLSARSIHQSQETHGEDSVFEYNPSIPLLHIPSKCPIAQLNFNGTAFADSKNKCSFYACAAESADKSKTCDLKDKGSYFLNYGEKYCERFSKNTSEDLSPQGRIWLNKTLACLQSSIVRGCNEKKQCFSCQSIRKLAFDTHPHCYVDSGLCSLSLKDQIQVGKTVDASDFFTTESLMQVKSVAVNCGTFYTKQGLHNVTNAVNEYRRRDPIFNRYVQAQPLPSDSQANYARDSLAWSRRVRYVSPSDIETSSKINLLATVY